MLGPFTRTARSNDGSRNAMIPLLICPEGINIVVIKFEVKNYHATCSLAGIIIVDSGDRDQEELYNATRLGNNVLQDMIRVPARRTATYPYIRNIVANELLYFLHWNYAIPADITVKYYITTDQQKEQVKANTNTTCTDLSHIPSSGGMQRIVVVNDEISFS